MIRGLDTILRNLSEAERKVVTGRISAAEEIGALLEAYAKKNAPFTDRTGNLRNSISSKITKVTADSVTLLLMASMNYAIYVEKRWGGKYAYLQPAIDANIHRIGEILRKRLGV